MKKVLLTISILMLIIGGYGETKVVYAETIEEPDVVTLEPNYTIYAANNIYEQTIVSGTTTVKAIARLKMVYAGTITEMQEIKNNVDVITGYKKVTMAMWNTYIETYTVGVDTSQKIVITNKAMDQISWNSTGTYTYFYLGSKITQSVSYRPAFLSETDISFSTRYAVSDINIRRLKTAGTITLQIDNTYREYLIGQNRSLLQIVNYDTDKNIVNWYDIDQGSPQYSPIFWTMTPTTEKPFEAQYAGSGGDDGEGPSQEQQDQLDDQNQSIQDAQDQIKDYEELEQDLLNDNAETLDDLDFTNNTQILTRPNFISTANWVKTRYEELITGTPLEAVLLLSLSVGLALYVLGRMNR